MLKRGGAKAALTFNQQESYGTCGSGEGNSTDKITKRNTKRTEDKNKPKRVESKGNEKHQH